MYRLKCDLRQTQSKAYASGTLRHFLSSWGSFKDFCSYFEFVVLPASEETVALYIQCLSRSVRAVSTIKNHVSAIRWVHKLNRAVPPEFTDLDILMALKGLSVDRGLAVRQAAPITPQILAKFYSHLDLTQPEDIAWWALFLVSFFLMLRSSNVTPQTRADYDPVKQLHWSSISLSDKVALVTITWTKTVQYRQRELVIPLLSIPGSFLCPVLALRRLASLGKISSQGAVFCDKYHYPLTYKAYLNKVKALAALSGLNPSEFSTHSFRRGGATFAYQAGVPLQLIQLQGDWQSLAVLRYLQYPMEARALVGAKMSQLMQAMHF